VGGQQVLVVFAGVGKIVGFVKGKKEDLRLVFLNVFFGQVVSDKILPGLAPRPGDFVHHVVQQFFFVVWGLYRFPAGIDRNSAAVFVYDVWDDVPTGITRYFAFVFRLLINEFKNRCIYIIFRIIGVDSIISVAA
jgi:hypothetical protein